VKISAGNGTSGDFISGYEIHTKDWYELDHTLLALRKQLKLIPNEHGELVKVVSIFDLEQDLFNWLAFLDINVIIILVLMLLIGIINMGSALLVLIIIRSNFIGLMKAMGGSNRQLRRIFLIQAAYLVGSGMFIGNIAGLALYALQRFTGMLALNPEVYYLDRVPVELTLNAFLLLNLGSFVVCMTALLLPSALIARVNPVKTIKFN
jgi:lipoprotein-releasing system permease protein